MKWKYASDEDHLALDLPFQEANAEVLLTTAG